eukprot:c14162_g1_i1.p2 GENE.c14162_g1_i1~~c14162_g1_i1.p2  ORF type:complete len:288 (+),score=-90.85 c14162_g1_i1:21-884(+)
MKTVLELIYLVPAGGSRGSAVPVTTLGSLAGVPTFSSLAGPLTLSLTSPFTLTLGDLTRSVGLLGTSLLALELFGVSPEEEVDHDVPRLTTGEGATEVQDLTSQQVVEESNGVLALVVGGDGNVDVSQRRVGVAESDGGNVTIGRLLDGLVVGAGVSQDQQTRLHELLGDLIGQGTGGPAGSNGVSTGVLSELQHSALAIRTSGDDNDVSGVLDGNNGAGSEHQLLIGLADVDDVDAVIAALPDVTLHGVVQILGAEVDLAGQHLLDVFFSLSQDGSHCLRKESVYV